MKDISHILTPMQEQLTKNLINDKIAKRLFEVTCKDVIVLVNNSQHFLQQVQMIGLENAPHPRLEIVIVKVIRQFLVVGEDHVEITLNQVQTFNYTVSLKKLCLWEDQHHKSV